MGMLSFLEQFRLTKIKQTNELIKNNFHPENPNGFTVHELLKILESRVYYKDVKKKNSRKKYFYFELSWNNRSKMFGYNFIDKIHREINSYNCYQCEINENLVKLLANAILFVCNDKKLYFQKN